MPKLIDNTLIVTRTELLNWGIPKGTVNWSQSNVYESLGEGYIYDSIPAKQRAKLPSRAELEAAATAPARDIKAEAVQDALLSGYASYIAHYASLLGVASTNDRVIWLAKGAAVVAAMYAQPERKISYYEWCAAKLAHLRDSNQLVYPTWDNPIYICRMFGEIKAGKAITDMVKPPRLGNQNRTAGNPLLPLYRYITFGYASCPMALSYVQVHQWLNWHIETLEQEEYDGKELPRMSLTWVRETYQKVKLLGTPLRRGMKAYRDNVRPYVQREDPIFPHDVWEMDGTRLNLPYKAEDGSLQWATVVLVLDGMSGCLIGAGIGKSENRWVVMDALNLAVKTQGVLPCEILTDNFGRGGEMKDVENQMTKLGVKFRRSKVGNAKDKRIERAISTLQTTGLRWLPQYTGEGVKSRRVDARPSPEWLSKQVKDNTLPSFAQLPALLFDAMAISNNYLGQRAESRRQILERGKLELGSPNAISVDTPTLATLFWAKTEATIKNGLLNITVAKVDYSYRIREYEQFRDYNGVKVAVRYDRHRPAEGAMLFDLDTDEIIGEVLLDTKVRQHSDDAALHIAAKEARTKEWERQMSDEVEAMAAAARELKPDLALTLDYRKVQKAALTNAEDALMREMYYDMVDLPQIPAPDTSELVAVAADDYRTTITNDHPKRQRNLYATEGSLKPIKPSSDYD